LFYNADQLILAQLFSFQSFHIMDKKLYLTGQQLKVSNKKAPSVVMSKIRMI